MSKKYLLSDLSKAEAYFLMKGKVLIGEENVITGLFKMIGMFNELKISGRKGEIVDYIPEKDHSFKYENLGITELSTELKEKQGEKSLNRKDFKALSRKWCPSRVRISFKCAYIITELVRYMDRDSDLRTAYNAYMMRYNLVWDTIMPIQFEFLSERSADEHTNYKIARTIINELSSICFL